MAMLRDPAGATRATSPAKTQIEAQYDLIRPAAATLAVGARGACFTQTGRCRAPAGGASPRHARRVSVRLCNGRF